MRRRELFSIVSIGLAVALLLAARPAAALVLDIATVVQSALGAQASEFTLGETLNIHLETDDVAVDLDGNVGVGLYLGGTQSFSVSFGTSLIALSAAPSVATTLSIFDNQVSLTVSLDTVNFGGGPSLSGQVGGASLLTLTLSLTSQGTPADPPTLVVNDRVSGVFTLDSAAVFITTAGSQVTVINALAAPVPEPAPVLLLLFSVVVVAASQEREKP